eukprot:jgi/Galph1/39/GphlegSOOS_G4802.1
MKMDTSGTYKPRFPKLNQKQVMAERPEIRRITVPANRYTPLKQSWMKIYEPLVQQLKLQVRMNLQTRMVELKNSPQTTDFSALQKGEEFVRAFLLGFQVSDALALLRLEDLFIDSFEVRDIKSLHGDHHARAIGRIAGKDGRMKFTIENATKTRIVLTDTRIHILGSYRNIQFAKDAVVRLILGSPPGKIYNKLRTVSARLNEPFFSCDMFWRHVVTGFYVERPCVGALVGESGLWTNALERRPMPFPKNNCGVLLSLRKKWQGHVLPCASYAGVPPSKASATPQISGSKLDLSESFLSGTSAAVLEDMYNRWKSDPSSVDATWSQFFSNLDKQVAPGKAIPLMPRAIHSVNNSLSNVQHTSEEDLVKVSSDTIKIMALIKAYRHRGHLIADLDPLKLDEDLGFYKKIIPSGTKADFEPASYGFSEADMDRKFVVNGELPGQPIRTLREIIQTLRKSYCGTIGVEYRHILSKVEKDWIAERVETDFPPFTKEQKRIILRDLADAELFEKFLAVKFPTSKRFGLEGAESLIPGLQALLELGSNLGIENVVLGMSHRGRLNVLANIIGSPIEKIFHEFYPHDDPFGETYQGSGDVKYHLGTSNTRKLRNGKSMHLSLVANPSHLEAVDPVVVGKTRAKQYFTGDTERKRTMALLLHGDASFAGQGVVQETLEFGDLRDYTTGGTVHLVVNNQIGFTTDPRYARSSPYPTDVAKTVGMPIFHVNGDDTEAVVRCCMLAMEYRQTFGKDVIIDMFCYRRHGHNETDQPTFTQPRMYKTIEKHPSTLTLCSNTLIKQQVVSKSERDKMIKTTNESFQKAFENAKHWVPKEQDWLSSLWEGFKAESELSKIQPTGAEKETLKEIGHAICRVPEGFHLHRQLNKFVDERRKRIDSETGIDWSTAEALAIGSLLVEGTSVRLSGQDSERGTFSQRHSVWIDQENEAVHIPLNNLGMTQARFQVCNSSLSEFGVMGFELGYSLESPNILVIWEAQFGDFNNGAQVIIDTFLAAGERKWRRQLGLTLLLPHGMEGQGPEHSSARLERYLQLCDDDPDVIPEMHTDKTRQIQFCNIQVANCSTPANYFHILRRQIHRQFRKPLILMTPKSLLRHPACTSSLEDFSAGKLFQRVLSEKSDDLVADDKIRRVLFCSGKVYYELFEAREKNQIKDIAIVRVEQLAPFPFDRVAAELGKYPNAEVVWCQEESKNMGAWFYVKPRMETTIRELERSGRQVSYIGRPPSASPATGLPKVHEEEQRKVVQEALK